MTHRRKIKEGVPGHKARTKAKTKAKESIKNPKATKERDHHPKASPRATERIIKAVSHGGENSDHTPHGNHKTGNRAEHEAARQHEGSIGNCSKRQ